MATSGTREAAPEPHADRPKRQPGIPGDRREEPRPETECGWAGAPRDREVSGIAQAQRSSKRTRLGLSGVPRSATLPSMKTHEAIDRRRLALARAVVDAIDRGPSRAGLDRARSMCRRWSLQSPSRAVAEWNRILVSCLGESPHKSGPRCRPGAAAPAAQPAPARSPAAGGTTRCKAGRFSTRRQAAEGRYRGPARRQRTSGTGHWLEWDAIRLFLLDPGEEGCRLRQSSPFCGILSARERPAIFRRFGDENRAL